MTPEELENELMKYRDDAAKIGEEWAVLKAEMDIKESMKIDILADIADGIDATSNAEKERRARLSLRWVQYLAELNELKKKAYKMKLSYETAVRSWETARSLLSSKNTERRSYI